MNNLEKKQLGYKGESLAKSYLESKGYTFVEQNFCVKGGEIDLIFEDNKTLVFVEVKTKHTHNINENINRMFERITPQKIQFLERSAQMYCLKKGYSIYDTDMRFDFVYVLYQSDELYRIEHEVSGLHFDD